MTKVNINKMTIYELFIKDYEWTSHDDRLSAFISNDRRERMERYRLLEDKKNCLYSELIIKYHLLKETELNEENIMFKHTKEGKPFLTNALLNFNISHTKGGILCAISDEPIGIDIEKVLTAPTGIMKLCYSQEEIDEVNKLQGEELNQLFYYIWTRKEAYCKWNGLGITQNLKNIITLHNSNYNLYRTWYKNGYCISICSAEENPEFHKIELTESSIFDFYFNRSL